MGVLPRSIHVCRPLEFAPADVWVDLTNPWKVACQDANCSLKLLYSDGDKFSEADGSNIRVEATGASRAFRMGRDFVLRDDNDTETKAPFHCISVKCSTLKGGILLKNISTCI